ncbi:efflux RND transporter permease subunit [Aquimarina gracilis]|uniref:Efflux RND transporter permease subunit n=1 Tax=Aquimarina gracilis TaxID=874422 RepID=A0ABU5ZQC7_9FLAO|nr:efflux RND transporter permease subunit [Aquimarina gracilis]MEB3344263.1 efflux RND transporter permease subunit [Aquimarina gracilis]
MNEWRQNFLRLSSFSKIILFTVLGLIGITFISFLSIRLQPQQNIPVISIDYSWVNQNPRIIESEVTTKIERSISKMDNLINVSSVTSKGQGSIRLEFSKDTDLDKASLYISSIVRQIYPSFPEGVSFPNISKHGINKTDKEVLMSLAISGDLSKKALKTYTENIITPQLVKIKGITEVELFGAPKYSYVITCRNSKIEKFNLNIDNVKSLIVNFLKRYNLGVIQHKGINTNIQVDFGQKNNDIYDILNIPIITKKNESILLKNIITISEKEDKLQGYKRYNGYDALTIYISTEKKENQLTISKKLRNNIEILNEILLKDNVQISILYDSTIKLKSELNKVLYRISFSLGILLIFVFFINRNFKYVFLVLTTLVLNILFAVIFYYTFSIDIHLYSLAGLTISLGIIIDNTIIMIDHLINSKNKKVFISILAATITTVGSLIMVFFIKKEYQLYLLDFSWIIIINLITSLSVTFFLVPSLIEKVRLKKKSINFSKKRKIFKLTNRYKKVVEILVRKRKLVFIFFIFLFGLPLFLLPEEIQEDTKLINSLNLILQSDFYKEKLFPNFKHLGGTLYTFLKSTEKSSFISSPKRLSIKIRIFNPEGGTINQLDKAVKSFEKSLFSFKEVDFFLTEVEDVNNGFIKVFLKEEYENTDVPYTLKNKLEAIAIQIGGMDCSIFGVGQPFSNSGNLVSDATIKLKGYNLDDLLQFASEIKDKILLKHPRISNVKISSEKSFILKEKYEYVLNIRKSVINNNEIINSIKWNSGNEIYIHSLNNQKVTITGSNDYLSIFDFKKNTITHDSTSFSVGQITDIQKKNVVNNVVRKNNNYEVYLDYSFAGTHFLNNSVNKELLREINIQLPVGYEALHPNEEYFTEKSDYLFLKITLIIFLIIYFICAILFESLTLPLAIILTIPFSFIGVFLTFSLFDIPFDQGGLASFIMLSGIVVNSSIYVLNEYKNIKRKGASNLSNYIKAISIKITPISLTIISTILGLLPFVMIEGNDFFWTSFAYGNIGGLIFSFIVILFFLPVCLKLNTQKFD